MTVQILKCTDQSSLDHKPIKGQSEQSQQADGSTGMEVQKNNSRTRNKKNNNNVSGTPLRTTVSSPVGLPCMSIPSHPIPSRSSQSQRACPIRPEDACKPHIPSFPVWPAVTTSHPHLSHPITPCGSKSAPLQPARSGLSCELALQQCNTTSGYRHWIAQKLPTMNHDQGTTGQPHRSSSQENPPERDRESNPQYDNRPIKRRRKKNEESLLPHTLTPYLQHEKANVEILPVSPHIGRPDKVRWCCEPVTKSKAATFLLHAASCVACHATHARTKPSQGQGWVKETKK